MLGVWPRLKTCPDNVSLYTIVDVTGERAKEAERLIANDKAVSVPSDVDDVVAYLWLCEAMIEEVWFQKALCVIDDILRDKIHCGKKEQAIKFQVLWLLMRSKTRELDLSVGERQRALEGWYGWFKKEYEKSTDFEVLVHGSEAFLGSMTSG